MPIYMDRHDVSEEVTAENVAHLHQHDLNIQDKYNCKALTYWFDDARKTAFCLVEAPNKEAMIAMHDAAHGEIPSEIIEVEKSIVESFLGRIEDPEKAMNAELNIINDPAFRSVVMIKPNFSAADKNQFATLKGLFTHSNKELQNIISADNGRIVKIDFYEILLSFIGVSDAINFAISFKRVVNKWPISIGISAGIPITEKNGFFENAIEEANLSCSLGTNKIVVSKEVNDLFESENSGNQLSTVSFRVIQSSERLFLKKLIAFTEKQFDNDNFQSSDFHKTLGYSKSQFYRKITIILGKSPNLFLKDFRLNKSLHILHSTEKTISEIAFLVGFKSQSQYSKSFQKHFGTSPTTFRAQN